MKFIKKIISFEPLIIWFRYFLTIRWNTVLFNFGIPTITSILLGIFKRDYIEQIQFDVFSIGSILVGFCSSILIMLFTLDGVNTSKLKTTELQGKKISLHQALIYKFSFIVINLLILMLVGILAVFLGFEKNLFYNLYIVAILINTLFTLLEALTNVIFCLTANKK